MKTKFFLKLFLMLSMSNYGAHAQEIEKEYKHGLSFIVTHTYISKGIIDREQKWLAAPSLALNYNYIINEKWSVGLHNDIIIESFVVENEEDHSIDFLERDYPVSNLILSTYKVNESLGLAIGGGIEWAGNTHFELIRLGTDYDIELNKHGLGIILTLNYDILIGAYDSFNFGIGINKLF